MIITVQSMFSFPLFNSVQYCSNALPIHPILTLPKPSRSNPPPSSPPSSSPSISIYSILRYDMMTSSPNDDRK